MSDMDPGGEVKAVLSPARARNLNRTECFFDASVRLDLSRLCLPSDVWSNLCASGSHQSLLVPGIFEHDPASQARAFYSDLKRQIGPRRKSFASASKWIQNGEKFWHYALKCACNTPSHTPSHQGVTPENVRLLPESLIS